MLASFAVEAIDPADAMPASVTPADIEHIAALARLALTENEKALFARQLAAILEYAQQIQRVDTRDIPPTTHVLAERTPLREDEVHPGLSRDAALANAPEPARDEGFFKVPRVIG